MTTDYTGAHKVNIQIRTKRQVNYVTNIDRTKDHGDKNRIHRSNKYK